MLDKAAEVESQTDFARYFEKIVSESVAIEGTVAERYLKNQGIENINISSVQFHPAVWERETQTHMPALVAKAVGQGETGFETKGIQVTFLDNETGNKAILDQPIRYIRSSDAIIMLQKPSKPDHRSYVAADIETGLAVSKANPDIRVAALATQERFDKNPLQGQRNKELIFCASHTTPSETVDRAVSIFTDKQFSVRVVKPTQEKALITVLNDEKSHMPDRIVKTDVEIQSTITLDECQEIEL